MNKKTKPKTRKAAKAKKKTAKQSLALAVYEMAKGYNFFSEYAHQKDAEAVALYPKNANAEKIAVLVTRINETQTRIEMYRIAGGEKEVSLSVVIVNSSRAESASLLLIKTELKRFC